MKLDPSEEWERFAAREPYYAVFAHEKYRGAATNEEAREDFFRSGEDDVESFFHLMRQRIATLPSNSSALDVGCGPGRLAIPLARRLGKVVGVDVSRAMLAEARANADRLGISNVEFRALNDVSGTDDRFDFVICHLVLHRMPARDGLELLRWAAERVRHEGFALFEVPYRSTAARAVRLSRWIRGHVPGVEAALGVVRESAVRAPFTAPQVYDLNDVFAILESLGFEVRHAASKEHGDLRSTMLYVQRRAAESVSRSAVSVAERQPSGEVTIDVGEIIRNASIEDLNRKAEEYFSSLKDWEHHLSKPFNRVEDAPAILINFATLLQGLSLTPGMTVLDYGAGSGWVSRFLTQFGCRSILLDVSTTALEIARELYRRNPTVGERPEPLFLPFDGRRIALEDASVDRIVCFDAFHHAPNPDDIIREFARILVPGGIAAFAEPGPNHSRSAQSQFEMRTYGVVENDVDLRAIWNVARTAGFSDVRVAAFNVPPFHLSLDDFETLLSGGEALRQWSEATRRFMFDARDFFLIKEGGETISDSRSTRGLHAAVEARLLSEPTAGKPLRVAIVARNSGSATWLPSGVAYGGVSVGAHLYDAAKNLIAFEYAWIPLGDDPVTPGAEAPRVEAMLPALESGKYVIEIECVANGVAWFGQIGSTPAVLHVDVR